MDLIGDSLMHTMQSRHHRQIYTGITSPAAVPGRRFTAIGAVDHTQVKLISFSRSIKGIAKIENKLSTTNNINKEVAKVI